MLKIENEELVFCKTLIFSGLTKNIKKMTVWHDFGTKH